jgi:glycosyltransferase involved in cell wall biosynthesis
VKIVHVITRLNLGGAALAVLELAAGQRARGHDAIVITGTIPAGEESMESVADDLGVPYIRLPELQRELSLRADARAVREVRRLIRARRPDVVHTHTSKAGAAGRIAAATARDARPRAVVHEYHGHVLRGYFDSRRERFFRLVERALAHITDRLIAVSAEVRDDLVGYRIAPAGKFDVVRYGFDLDGRTATTPGARERARAEIGAGPDAFVIGWIGRLTAIKRPLDLIRVVAEVDSAILVLIGDGEDRAEVEQLVASLEVTDRVHLLGYQQDVAAWYAAFDAFLLVSANEGTPVVAIEALAAGVPVVATDAGGTSTVVDDGETGALLPVGDVAGLARALNELRSDPERRSELGRRGAERMRERFSVSRMVDDVERIYAGILSR